MLPRKSLHVSGQSGRESDLLLSITRVLVGERIIVAANCERRRRVEAFESFSPELFRFR